MDLTDEQWALVDPLIIRPPRRAERHELLRAQAGEWLPQALQVQRKTLQQALARLERQQTRLHCVIPSASWTLLVKPVLD